MKIGEKVKVKHRSLSHWYKRTGELKAIVRTGRDTDYIVQFKRPSEWGVFEGKELILTK